MPQFEQSIRAAFQPFAARAVLAGIEESGGKIRLIVEIDPKLGSAAETLRQEIEAALRALKGIEEVEVIMTAERAAPARKAAAQPEPLADVKAIIAVASGKGGVGKSTVAVNLALAFAANGLKTGLLDADIYGPSLPRLLNVGGKPEIDDAKRMIPLEAQGLKVMSMGFLVDADKAAIWRGAMVHGAVQQMLRQAAWGPLDILVVDMPPGTGDAHLTLTQTVPLAGAVIVSTPQDIALIDARKGIALFRKLDVPILGIIENMSYYCCPTCGHRAALFGHGGAAAEAETQQVKLLGEIPLDIRLRETGDAGTPIVLADPQGEHAKTFRAMAEEIAFTLSS
jgi:ATP-binding protein involved in chromosome partitioning